MTASEMTDGFGVTTDALVRIRSLLNDSTETHHRERDAESLRDPGPGIDSYRHPSHAAVQPVPSWHAELDRRWREHRAALLTAQDLAAHNLAFNVRSYLECEAAVTVLIRDGQLPDGLGRVPESGFGGDVLAPAGVGEAASITDIDHAAAVWRRRRDSAAETGSRLDDAIEDSEWTGPAADAFRDWVRAHVRRWHQLRRAADTVVRALTEPVRPDDLYDRGPDVPDLTDRPPPSGLPDPAPISPPTPGDWNHASGDPHNRDHNDQDRDDGAAAAPDEPVTAGTGAPPALPSMATAAEPAPDASPADQATTGDVTPEVGSDVGAEQPAAAAPVDVPRSSEFGELVPGQITSALDPGPAALAAPDPVPPGEVAPLPGATGHHPAHHGANPSDPPEPMSPPMLPAAAVAGATALARADRAYYVVREIAVPPDPTRPAPPEPRTTDPVLSPPDRFRTALPPAAPPSGGSTPPGASPLPAVPPPSGGAPAGLGWPIPPTRHDPAWPLGAGTALGVPAPASRPSRAMPRRGTDRMPMWVNLQPTTAAGAWIDLTARPGLGLHGPDPAPVVRTALHELYVHTTTVFIVPRDLLDDLTGEPSTDPSGGPSGGPVGLSVPRSLVPPGGRVHVVDDPFDGLHALTRHVLGDRDDHPDHYGGNRDGGNRDGGYRDGGGPDDVPDACLLVARAPRSTAGRDELARTLAALHPAPAGALLLGFWPHGAALHLDDDHRVIGHHHPADPGADLTGHRLHPTSPDRLADALRPGPPDHHATPTETAPPTAALDHTDPGTDDHRGDDHRGDDHRGDDADQDQQNRDNDVRGRDVRDQTDRQEETALTLSVFGTVELYYRPTEPPQCTSAAGAVGEDARVLITRLPRLARALLAYLATEPAGFTREHLIETLCPGSRAQRADGPLQTALSRLRSRIADVTGDKTHDDIIVTDGTRWMLNPATVTADTWALFTAFTPRAADYSPEQRRRDLHAAVSVYRGLFDTDLPGRWAHQFRETASVHYRHIIHDLAEIEVRRGDDNTALLLLERAREIEQANEGIYRSIMKIQLRNGRTDDARATFALLQSHLAAIDATPEPETSRLITGRAS